MELLSQQDPRWANTKIGNSAYYMWAKGSFLTEIAQAIGKTPDYVNERLTEVDGFLADSAGEVAVVNWAKISEAFPGWSAELKTPYDNQAAEDALTAGKRVILAVDGLPLGIEGNHAALYLGNGKCINSFANPAVEIETSFFSDIKGFIVLSEHFFEIKSEENPVTEKPAVDKQQILERLDSLIADIKTLLDR